jgi:hypothetical protein
MYGRIIAAFPAGTFLSTRKLPFPTIQADQLPGLGVYLLREQMSPDGDDNVGPPRYMVDAVISVMIIDLASDPSVLEGSIDSKIDQVEETLLTDYTFLDLRESATDQPIIESVPQITRTYQFPRDGDRYYIEARLQMTFRFRCKFPPKLINDLHEIDVDVRQGGDDFHETFTITAGP